MRTLERKHNPRKPIRGFNTTQVGRGGDQSGRYHAKAGWEGIEAARARENIDPAQVILDNIGSLRERFYATLDKTFTVDPRKTKAKIAKVRLLISKFSGNKENFLQELARVEESFASGR